MIDTLEIGKLYLATADFEAAIITAKAIDVHVIRQGTKILIKGQATEIQNRNPGEEMNYAYRFYADGQSLVILENTLRANLEEMAA